MGALSSRWMQAAPEWGGGTSGKELCPAEGSSLESGSWGVILQPGERGMLYQSILSRRRSVSREPSLGGSDSERWW